MSSNQCPKDEFQEYPWLSKYWRESPGLPEPFRHEFQLIWNRFRDDRLLIDALVKERDHLLNTWPNINE